MNDICKAEVCVCENVNENKLEVYLLNVIVTQFLLKDVVCRLCVVNQQEDVW